MDAILSVDNINKSFGQNHVLQDVKFDLRYNEIHGLIGENGAGKSTLMKIIAGDYTMDSGEISYCGKPVIIKSPAEVLAMGIRIIYQEFNLVRALTVAENICLGNAPKTKNGLVDWKEMNKRAERIIEMMGESIKVTEKVRDLSIAEQQLVEIAKALSMESKVLIMDEPTAALNDQETHKLFSLLRKLRDGGLSIIFITHRLAEQFELSDRITVLRDGITVGTLETKETTTDQLVKMMVGRELKDLYAREKGLEPGELIFKAEGLNVSDRIKNVNLHVRAGEIVTVFGLMGAGQDELCKAIVGDIPLRGGQMTLNGKPLSIKNTTDAKNAGLGYVSNDRKNEGLIPSLHVTGNITLAALKKMAWNGIIQKDKEQVSTQKWITRLKIRCSSAFQRISSLSGGNQQKAMIARWLTNDTKLMMLNMPTRGVDVGAKADIYATLEELVKQGVAVIVFSLEMPEVLGISDRIYVMCEGELVAEVPIHMASQDILMQHAVSKYI